MTRRRRFCRTGARTEPTLTFVVPPCGHATAGYPYRGGLVSELLGVAFSARDHLAHPVVARWCVVGRDCAAEDPLSGVGVQLQRIGGESVAPVPAASAVCDPGHRSFRHAARVGLLGRGRLGQPAESPDVAIRGWSQSVCRGSGRQAFGVEPGDDPQQDHFALRGGKLGEERHRGVGIEGVECRRCRIVGRGNSGTRSRLPTTGGCRAAPRCQSIEAVRAIVKNQARNSTSEPRKRARFRLTRTQVSDATSSTQSRWRTRRYRSSGGLRSVQSLAIAHSSPARAAPRVSENVGGGRSAMSTVSHDLGRTGDRNFAAVSSWTNLTPETSAGPKYRLKARREPPVQICCECITAPGLGDDDRAPSEASPRQGR